MKGRAAGSPPLKFCVTKSLPDKFCDVSFEKETSTREKLLNNRRIVCKQESL